MMKISKEIKAMYRELSRVNDYFMEFAAKNPDTGKRSSYKMLESEKYLPRLQSWPTFISKEQKETFEDTVVKIFDLIKSIPRRVFDNDPQKMSAYYEQPPDVLEIQIEGVTEEHMATLLGRGDFLVSPSGVKCVEFNISANISVLEAPIMESLYLNTPVLKAFFKEYGVHIKNENTLALILDRLIDHCRAGGKDPENDINIALVMDDDVVENLANSRFDTYINNLYQERLALKNGLTGTISTCAYHHLQVINDVIYLNRKRIHILLEFFNGLIPPGVMSAFTAGNVRIINGPITGLLSNKLNLALLSENEDSHIFTPRERKIIKDYIPWSRKLTARDTDYRTGKIKLPDFIISNRGQFVIKPSIGLGGEGVYIGKHTPGTQWEQLVRTAIQQKNWLVQERVEAAPAIYQVGENGYGLHDIVWGLFVCGRQYMGGFLRVLPQTMSEGVVNEVRGAECSSIFEVDANIESARDKKEDGSILAAATAVERPGEKLAGKDDGNILINKIEEQVEKTPGNLAVVTPGKTFTYRELNGYANRIARLILKTGAGEIVGLLFDHGAQMIAAILGTLKAGKIYVPLSVDYPQKRITYMLSDSGASLLLTNTAYESTARELSDTITLLNIDEPDAGHSQPDPDENPTRKRSGHKNAYILYTSGSTGRPKGVVQTHQNADYYNRNWVREFSITPNDRMALLSSFCHDMSVQDIFSALYSGAALFPFNIRNREITRDLSAFLIDEKITVWHSVASLFGYFANTLTGSESFPQLRLILLGGEAVRQHEVDLWEKYFPQAALAIVYGQTESSVNSIYLIRQHQQYKKTLIGTPPDGMEIFVVDEEGREVDPLEVGEILVACRYISPGYWKNPKATRKVFIPDETYGQFYRTGDMGRLLANGSIEFLGRKDHQVKIRGFRVEPREIESQLLKYPGIEEAVTTVKEDETGDKHLCAYYVSREELAVIELRTHLQETLPDYMIPSFFTWLDKMPLTPGGKIDRKALPAVNIGVTGSEYIAPGDEVEEKLVEIWAAILSIKEKDKIGIKSDFFQLSGHSLRAMMLVSQMQKEFDVEVPLAEIFRNSTISGLAEYIKSAKQERYVAIEPTEKKEYYVMSSVQKRLYILQQLDPESMAYNLPDVLPSDETIDDERLQTAFKKLIARHESLRTSFHVIDGQPVQNIHDNVEFKIESFRQECGVLTAIKNIIRPFDFSRAPLLRALLIETAEEELLLVDIHHIITDDLSGTVLIEEFMALYSGEELPPLRLQYKDYTQWQNSPGQQQLIKRKEAYWLKVFPDEIPTLKLPYDFSRPAIQSSDGNSVRFGLTGEETKNVRDAAKKSGTTHFIFILTVFNILLSKLSGQEDIIVGTPIAGRRHADLQRIIGMFVNTLAIRSFPAGDKIFKEFLNELKERMIEAYENQEYPFENLVEKVLVQRDIGRNPIFDVMFNFLNAQEYPGDISTMIKETRYKDTREVSLFDLSLTGIETAATILFRLEYCTTLFNQKTIRRFIRYFKGILSAASADPHKRISKIEIVTDEEKEQLLYEFNDTAAQYPKDKIIHELFEEQAAKIPDNIALVGIGYRENVIRQESSSDDHGAAKSQVTYKELNEKSNRLAEILRSSGVKPGAITALMSHRSVEMIEGMMSILKAGGCYLPIDPGYPGERIQYMLQDSGAGVLLCHSDLYPHIEDISYKGEILDLIAAASYSYEGRKHNLNTAAVGDSPIYLEYTSGSTGKPKGVLIEHRNVVNFMQGVTSCIDFSPGKIILALTTICFDIFVLETLVPLVCGLKVIIAKESQQKNPELLGEMMIKNNVNMVQMTPSSLLLLMNNRDHLSCLHGVSELMVGGEHFPGNLFERVKTRFDGKIYNLYGPTETTVWSTLKDLTGSEKITIGRPIHNTCIYIVDRWNCLQPPGAPGELYIGGEGLARGYLNQPGLTAEKFAHASWAPREKEQKPPGKGIHMSHRSHRSYIYKTGDLARWRPDGNIEILGRLDEQVKLRGFRIELGEIESHLLKHEDIKEAVVIASQDDNMEKHLWAYFISEKDFNVLELREYLSGKLTDYMIPSHFVQLEALPLTPNGKVDRKLLSLPGMKGTKLGTGKEYVQPGTDLEKVFANIWKEVLRVDKIGIHDNFFELGGNSMDVINLNNKLKETLNVDIPVAVIYRYMTISSFVLYLTQQETCREMFEKEVDRSEEIKKRKSRVKRKIKRIKSIY